MKRMAKALAVASLAVAAGVPFAASASAASLAQVTTTHLGSQAAFDNSPGNGAQSWVWVYSGSTLSSAVHYWLKTGGDGWLWTGGHSSTSKNLGTDVSKIQVCVAPGAGVPIDCGGYVS